MPWESLPTEVIKREQQCWSFRPEARWHGYAGYADGYAMVDPNKLALLTPGIDRKTGEYLDFGVPATVVANYLREQRVVPEKCDLNSMLFLMTPAEDESKLNTLIAKLVQFKNLWDRDAPLAGGAADGVRRPQRALRRLHAPAGLQRDARLLPPGERQGAAAPVLPRLELPRTRDVVRSRPTRRWWPTRSTTCRSRRRQGRISATLALIYPPGIGVIVPGERWDERARPMRDYFLAFEESFNRFPGFNYEVQGVFQERVEVPPPGRKCGGGDQVPHIRRPRMTRRAGGEYRAHG